MIGQSFSLLAQLVFGNPLVEMTLSALPNPLRTELQDLRRLVLSGDLNIRPQEVRQGDVDGERVGGVGLCLGDVKSGHVRGANVLRGRVLGGTVRAVNLLQGDVEGGEVSAVNVVAGAVRGGTVKAVNLLLGPVYGGDITRVNLVVGDVHGGRLQAAALIGDIHGGDVSVTFHHGVRHPLEGPSADAPAGAAAEPPDGTH